MNFYFSQHAFHPVIPRGVEDEVAETMRKSHRIDIDSATPCKPSVQNDLLSGVRTE